MKPFTEAFRGVFDAEFHSLFRYLHRMMGDSDAAGDLAQEAFVRLYQRGEMPDEPRAWLVTVANNLMRDEHRMTSRRRRILESHPDPFLRSAGGDPEDDAIRAERKDRVRLALAALPSRDKAALLLRSEGYSYREIAAALDYGVAGIGKLILRARRQFLAAYEAGDAPD